VEDAGAGIEPAGHSRFFLTSYKKTNDLEISAVCRSNKTKMMRESATKQSSYASRTIYHM
jgi:hypothetical protein